LDRTAIILADGFSSRLGQDKGLLKLMNKPLVRHVLDAINPIVNEKIVIVSSSAQVESYSKVLDSKTIVFTDFKEDKQSPLLGALTGFTKASGKYSVLLSCDFPLVSRDVVSLLFELSANKNAVIPRWPNCCVEPLHAIYCTKAAQEAARKAVDEGKLNMQAMIDKLRFVRYISTLVLQQLDPELRTFLNIETPMALKRAEKMLKTCPH
jgi:molybdopterin-guanine dinucleotide biosynthesis protein A